jgi:hypothetical protein
VDDTVVTVAALASEQQFSLGLVERGAPLDELADVGRRLVEDLMFVV